MNSYYISFAFFAVILYLVFTDESVAKFIVLLSKLVSVNYQKMIWWLKNSPDNPIVRFLIYRRSYKMARELQKEFENKNK